jgi:Protein of unknown function (DUF3800)
MHQFTVYIDEAGDEGFGKLAAGPAGGQSRWLILGACIVSRENDLRLPHWRNSIVGQFPKKKTSDLHFHTLSHEQKIVVCQQIAKLPLGCCVTLSNKITIPGSKWENIFKQKGFLYNYLVRWLLERVTVACARKDQGAKIKIVFSRRRGTDYSTMKDYLSLMKEGREKIQPVRSINWSVVDIDSIAVENHSKWAGLQFADCMTSAFFRAVEPNIYGNLEPAYAKLLKGNMIKAGGAALGCGVSPVPSHLKCAATNDQLAFFDFFKGSEQAPGS